MWIKEKYINVVEKSDRFLSPFPIQGVCLLLYKILVDLVYIYLVLYTGFAGDYRISPNMFNIISVYLYIGIYTIIFYGFERRRTASSIMFIVMHMIYFVPITTYCSLGGGSSGFLFFAILYWTLFSILQIVIPVIVLKRLEMSEKLRSFLVYFLLIGTSILTVYLSWKYTGFRIVIDLRNVYGVRAEAAGYDMSTLFRYLQSFSTILIAMLTLVFLRQKKYVLVLGEMFLLGLNFGFAGYKTVLFMGILVLAGVVFWRKPMVSWILPGGIGLAVLALIEKEVFGHAYIIDFFFRRLGYVLAKLSDAYYRYFRNNPTEIFRGSFLGKLGFENPYKLSIPYVIGNNLGSQTSSCNNGLLADVWANLGMIGILIMPFILIVCFRLFDMATDGLPFRLVVGLAVYYAVIFSNSTWSTVLLTHGFLIMCAGFFMFPRDGELTGDGV